MEKLYKKTNTIVLMLLLFAAAIMNADVIVVPDNCNQTGTYKVYNDLGVTISGDTAVYLVVTMTFANSIDTSSAFNTTGFGTERITNDAEIGQTWGNSTWCLYNGGKAVGSIAIEPDTPTVLVMKVDQTTGKTDLFVNPNLSADEPVTPALTKTSKVGDFTGVWYRGGNDGNANVVDSICTFVYYGGDSPFNEVVKDASTTEPKVVETVVEVAKESSPCLKDFQWLVYEILPAGQIKPTGWLKQQMVLDLQKGITGHFDKINNTVNKNLFVNKNEKGSWWSGEHEGYWKDSVTRMAYLTDLEPYKTKVQGWMQEIMSHQEADGYIGIYPPDRRFMTSGENGELWTQSRIFMAMLAYYQYTGDASVLASVERAVQLTMSKYSETYFSCSPKGGGVSHGIGFFDVLEYLYRITGKKCYTDYAVFLYKDYCQYPPRDKDLTYDNLMNPAYKFKSHGAHVAEGMHMPYSVAAYTSDCKYKAAAQNALEKLKYHLTPAGALVSSEGVNGREGTGHCLCEYCCHTELNISLVRAMQLSGDTTIGDMVEKMTFNAAMGARTHPANLAVEYCSEADRDHIKNEHREQYCPCHAAACCTLNAGRLMPYYIEGMWMRNKKNDGLAALLYGPCTLSTTIDGVSVEIQEATSYPFSDQVSFNIALSTSKKFSLFLRVPQDADDVNIQAPDGAEIVRDPKVIEIKNTWKDGDSIQVHFVYEVQKKQTPDNKLYLQRGTLVYAIPFTHSLTLGQEHSVGEVPSGFYDYVITVKDNTGADYRHITDEVFTLTALSDGNLKTPWAHPPQALSGKMLNAQGRQVEVELIPLGCTVLRQCSFPWIK